MVVDKVEENKMGVMPVGKLLMNMSLPIMISMLIQALYNIVDSVFVSMISESAFTALSLAFPIQCLMVAFGSGVGVGMNALLSRALGQGNQSRAKKAAQNGIFLAGVSYVIFLFVGLFFIKPFYASQMTPESARDIYDYGVSYLSIACCFSFGLFAQFVFERLLQATGRTFYSMITQGVGAVFNIIFDPICIFTLKMGVAGAAIATVAGQCLAAALALILNEKYNKEVTVSMRGFKPTWKTAGAICAIGGPTVIMQGIGSVMNYLMNDLLMSFTDTAAAVFGAYYKLQSFVFMPVFGLNNGMIPIVAYNFGAKKRSRILKTVGLSMLVAEAFMLVGFALFQLVPNTLLGFFHASKDMLRIGAPALRTISLHYLVAGLCIVGGTAFQALGNGAYSMVVSVARQLVALLPAAYILAAIGGLNAVWWSFPIAEVVSLIATVFFLWKIYDKVVRFVPDNV